MGVGKTPIPGLLYALIGEYSQTSQPTMAASIGRVSGHYGLTDAERATLTALVFQEISAEEAEHPADRWARISRLRDLADDYPMWRPTLIVIRDVARCLGIADLGHAAEICSLMHTQGYLESRCTPNGEDHEYKWLRAFRDPVKRGRHGT